MNASRWSAVLLLFAACAPGPVQRTLDGEITGRGAIVDARQQGRWTMFEGGKRTATGKFAAGVPVGIWKRFTADGVLQERAVLKDGVRDGDAATFHRSGARASAGRYVAGTQEGAWVYWGEDGVVDAARTGWYRGGVKQ